VQTLQDRTAVVTGAGSGIGRATAHAFAERGAAVVLAARRAQMLEEAARECEALGAGAALVVQTDVTREEQVEELGRRALERFGRIDVLVNNAGKSNAKGILDCTEDEFDRTIAVNLKSCFNYIQAVAPVMLEGGGGRIVSMSSLNAHTGGVTSAVSKFAYASAKAGILGMTRALAKELGPTIAINAICPGIIETEVGNTLTRARGAELAKKIALGRVGKPQDVARMVAFLCAEEPNFITGQYFVIDGFQWEI